MSKMIEFYLGERSQGSVGDMPLTPVLVITCMRPRRGLVEGRLALLNLAYLNRRQAVF